MVTTMQEQPPVQSPHPPVNEAGTSSVLRSSCDACSACKIKCDKRHPQCGRCQAARINCVYGVSRKHGKLRARRQQNHGGIRPISNSIRLSDTMSNSERGSIHIQGEAHRRGTSSMASPRLPIAPMPERCFPDRFAAEFNQSPATSCASGAREVQEGDNVNILDTMSSNEALREPSDIDIFGPEEPESMGFFSTTKHREFPMIPFSPRTSIAQYGRSTASSISDTRSESSSLRSSHSCYKLAKSALNDLHNEQSYRNSPSSAISSPSPSSSSSTSSLSFDHVLCKTRKAVENVNQLLRCKCSTDPHLALLIAAVLSKVIVWYQVLAKIKRPMVSMESPSRAPSLEACSPDFTQFPSTIGDFSLDQEDREALARQLLLKELRKLNSALELFSNADKRWIEAGSGDDELLSERTGGLYLMLGTWLKTELARTTREIHGERKQNNPFAYA